jgi:hypothetical protein
VFAPEQIDLAYVARHQYWEDGPANVGELAQRLIQPSQSAVLSVVFRIPTLANGFRLILRSLLERQQRADVAALVNLSCC